MTFISTHIHTESYLSASKLSSFIERAKTLGRTHFTQIDQGNLSNALKAYGQAKKVGLKPILGIEVFFKDPACPIVNGTKSDRCKYFQVSVYSLDQPAYQEIVKLASKSDRRTVEIREEFQSLWEWSDLEHLSKFNTCIVLSGVHCIVGKLALDNRIDLAEKTFVKLKSLFGERLYIAMLCSEWSKKYAQVIQVTYQDGTIDSLMDTDTVSTDRARKIKAIELVGNSRHSMVKSKVSNGIHGKVDKYIQGISLKKGFLPLPVDAALEVNKALKTLADKHGIVTLATDHAFYAEPSDKVVQDLILEGKTKFKQSLHMKSVEEIIKYLQVTMKIPLNDAVKIVMNNQEWANKFNDFELKYDWHLASTDGRDPTHICIEAIRKNGRMKFDDPIYVERLKEEFSVLVRNGKKNMLPYFFPIMDIVEHYRQNGELTGPGRGSAAGSLLSYLLRITHVDPIKHGLSFSRFYSMTRIENNQTADVDLDLGSRTLLVGEDGKSGYLYSRWGSCAAQIGTRSMVRLKSAIKDVNRYVNGSVEKYIEVLTESLPSAPQGITDQNFIWGYEDEDGNHVLGLIDQSTELQEYIQKKPKEWEIVNKAIGVTRSWSKHASGFCISDIPISNLVPLRDGVITQYEAKQVEEAGILKYDFLVVNNIKDIQICIELINKKNNEKHDTGCFTHKGTETFIWSLPSEPEAFKSVWDGKTDTMFQISTKSMVPFVKDILPQSIDDLSSILSLVRPGPLDFVSEDTGRNMAEEFVHRKNGGSYEDIEVLNKIISETYSVLVYQEQVTHIAKELAGFSGTEAEILRENIGKKKAVELTKQKPKFVEGASKHISKEEAELLWNRIETFGRYSFNKSHGISYSYITYACIFLRHFYPLEWYAAILSNASESEISGKLWPYVKGLIAPPDINISTDQMEVDYANKKIRSKLGVIRGMGDKTIDPIVQNRPYKDVQDFVDKDVSGPALAHKLIHVGILDSLFKPNMSLEEKLKAYEDAVQIKKFQEKKAKADLEGKKIRLPQPKEGLVPQAYVNLHPLKDAAMKKAVLPTIPLDLNSLGARFSKVRDLSSDKPKMIDHNWDTSVFLVDGSVVERLDKLDGSQVEKDIYVACTAYVIESKEFSYSEGSKRALKLIVDCGGGLISEKVLWPDYESGQLEYDQNIGKGSIVTLFLRKRAQKGGEMNITSIVWEA
jgi:DNA-directed DNA polymerase III PolC